VEEDRLPDEAIVIRGGLNQQDVMQRSAQDEFELNGQYALSVAADASMTLQALAVANQTPHSRIRKTTVGRLRAAGFDVTPPKGEKRHADLILPNPPTDEVWEALEAAFDPPEPNPNRLST
jgi:hypothetical protein